MREGDADRAQAVVDEHAARRRRPGRPSGGGRRGPARSGGRRRPRAGRRRRRRRRGRRRRTPARGAPGRRRRPPARLARNTSWSSAASSSKPLISCGPRSLPAWGSMATTSTPAAAAEGQHDRRPAPEAADLDDPAAAGTVGGGVEQASGLAVGEPALDAVDARRGRRRAGRPAWRRRSVGGAALRSSGRCPVADADARRQDRRPRRRRRDPPGPPAVLARPRRRRGRRHRGPRRRRRPPVGRGRPRRHPAHLLRPGPAARSCSATATRSSARPAATSCSPARSLPSWPAGIGPPRRPGRVLERHAVLLARCGSGGRRSSCSTTSTPRCGRWCSATRRRSSPPAGDSLERRVAPLALPAQPDRHAVGVVQGRHRRAAPAPARAHRRRARPASTPASRPAASRDARTRSSSPSAGSCR